MTSVDPAILNHAPVRKPTHAVELTLLQEVNVARRVVAFHDIGMLAHGGTHKELSARRSTPGGSDIGLGLGSYHTDGKGVHGWYTVEWSVRWPRIAQLALAGLTVGNLAGYSEAAWRWHSLHDRHDLWVTNCSAYPRSDRLEHATGVNAANDPLAYETSWWPEYRRVSDLMRAVLDDVFDTAYDVLTTERAVDVQLAFALT